MKKFFTLLTAVVLIVVLCSPNSHAQITVSGSNTKDGTYTSLTKADGAFAALNSVTQSGQTITITIAADVTSEDGATSLTGVSGMWTSLTIYPAVTGLSISGSVNAPLINLNGADYVTIDGRVGATGTSKDLIITNTNTGSSASTIRFVNSAENNIVQYCHVKGSSTNTSGGIINFGTSTSGNGNDGNTIDSNDITSDDAGRATHGIFSLGSAGYDNSGNTVSNNNIFDVFNSGIASCCIHLHSYSTLWNISGNSFYETSSFVPTADVPYCAIQINYTSGAAGTGFTLSGNYVGGSSPMCGGSWMKSNAQNNPFFALNLSVGTTPESSIQKNKIQNFSWSNSGAASWTGIQITLGAVNIGTVTGNIIGDPGATGSITVTGGATGSNVYGINIAGNGTINIQNNLISSITAANGDNARASNVYGIFRGNTATTNISNNTIGSTSTANSIQASSTSTANAQSVYGIYNSTGGTLIINNNTIANLKNATANIDNATEGLINGIASIYGINTLTNNTISNLSIANANTSATHKASVCGIALNSSNLLNSISGNSIYNLSNTYASFEGSVIGLYFGSTGMYHTVTNNFIHSLSVTGASSESAYVYGIKINTGATTYANNIINLGGNTATTIYGIYETGTASNNNNIYFNTVHIGGNLSSGITNKSYALYSAVNTNSRNFRNNIFENSRSTEGGASLHYAAYFNYPVSGSLTLDYNDYYAPGTGGILGYFNGADVLFLPVIPSLDVNSLSVNPGFLSPGGTLPANYIPANVTLAGTRISTVPTDYASVNRAGTPTMGAYEVTLDLNIDVYLANVFQSGYTTLKGAFDKINSGLHTGDIEIRIKANTIETSSAMLLQSGYVGADGVSDYSSVHIYPTVTGIVLSGNFNAPLIDLNGADLVIVDGRVGATGSTNDLVIANANTGTFASAIRFINSAENNTVKFCNISSSCYNAGVGIINFTSSASGNGNDNNIVEYCNITSAGGNRPYNAIFSSGATGRLNSGNIIRNNNIYNFFNPNNSSYGINISNSSTDWTITNNSFYETTTIAPGGEYKYYPLFINTGNNNLVSNNYIGGSEPLCAGSAFTVLSNSAHYFCGIFINGGTAATVQNNIIRNMNYTSVEDNPWDGIFINSGNVEVIGNTIGETTGTGSIVLTTPVASATTTITAGEVTAINLNGGGSGYTTPPIISFSTNSGGTGAAATAIIIDGVVTGFNLTSGGTGYTSAPSVYFDGQSNNYSTSHGMIKQSNGTVTISENNIGSITTEGSADRYSHGFESIYVRGIAGTLTISNNLIGSLTTEKSIHTSSTAASSLQKQDVYGIYSSGIGTTTISGNTIANLHNAYTGINSGARTRGILTTAGSNTVQNNTVRNISTASGQSSFASSASVIGISQISATAGTTQSVTGNIIYGLSNTNTNHVRVDLYGLYFAGPTTGTHEVSGNFVHGLSVSSPNVGSDIDGIVINSGSVVTCANNIVNLGENITLGYKINGIWDGTLAGNTVNFYFNAVYIGGTVTSGVTSLTSALNNANNTSTRNYRNNILYNARSGGTTGKHYAIVIAGVAGLTIDYNDYFFAGPMLGKIGTLEKADLIAWKAGTGQDLNSLSINPGYTLAGGTDALDYYTSASLPGVSGTGITTDYIGNARAANPKMGALEANNYTWQGSISSDFGTAANWVGGAVPPDGADIVFAATPANHCVLDGARTVKDITNNQSAYDLVLNGNQLSITGNLIFSGGAQIDAASASSKVVFAGSIAQIIPLGAFVSNTIDSLTINNANGLTLYGDLTINQGIALIAGNFSIGPNTLTFNGIVTAMTGTVTGGSSTNMIIGGTGASINMPAFLLNNLTINRLSGVSLYGDVSIVGTLTLTAGTFTIGSNSLTISGNAPERTSGAIDASNAGATLVFTNSSATTLPASVFTGAVNNLTINSAGGITASSDFTINGILNLQSANPGATKGCLDMWDGSAMKTLTMGANATTIGIGDVTGIVKRTSFVANTLYSFGNPFTTVTFPNTGTLPTEWSFKIKIGSAPTWKTDAIQRTYDIIRTGGAGSFPTVKLHYLDSELNSNPEADLVFFGYVVSNSSVTEYGRVNADIHDNWVSLSGSIEFAPESFDEREWSLSERELPGYTWQGTVPGNETDWDENMNWVGGSVPISNSDVIIPAGCSYYPTLPSSTAINSISIENGAVVNGGTSTTLTINGGNAAWFNRGTFNPETSTIIFTNAAATMSGETNFFNLAINSGAGITLTTDNIMRVAGSLFNDGSLDATEFPNTVEFNGNNQTIINPNGATAGYYHLILSGSGTKTLPATALSVTGNFTTAGTATATAGAVMTIGGNLYIEEGTTFNTGNFNHSISGNFINDGTFTASSGNTITMNGSGTQSMSGSSITNFNNLTIDNSHGVTLFTDENINNVLTLTNGNLIVGLTTLGINGTISKTSGSLEVSSLSSLSFGGTAAITITSNLFSTIPSLNNLTINRSGGVTIGNQNMTINGVLDLQSGTLSLAANTLTLAGSSPTRTSGTIDASYPAATLAFTNPVALTLPSSIFTGYVNNLTVNGLGGITVSSDFILNGILSLQSENPSATKGSLDMWDGSAMKTLTMGANATTTGPGDVTGIIRRATIIAEVTYTFGNEFTTAYFPNIGTLPDEISAKISIGTVPSWRPGAIAREIEIIQTGGNATKAEFSFHYLDAELNGNNEEYLVLWVKYNNYEYGRSAFNPVENWVSLSNVNVAFFSSNWDGIKNITLDEYSTTTTLTWNGSVSDSWTSVENWTPNAGPSPEKNIIIPDASTTLHSPTLPAFTEIKTITINAAGILNSVPEAQLTINGATAWINVGGTFNPNTSNVIFTNADATITGTTNFYDVTTTAGKVLWLISGSTMRIAGTMTNNGTWRTVIGGPTVVEYNGADQIVVVPNPATNRYSTLILSGSGTKTMPSSALSIEGDFSILGTASATAGSSITFADDVNIGSGAYLNLGAFSHAVGGDISNNGGSFASTNSSVIFNGTGSQTITSSDGFSVNDLTITNTSADVTLGTSTDCTIGGNLTIDTGAVFDLAANRLTDVTGLISNSGTITTLSNSASPVPSGKTWGGTFNYNGSAAQTLVAGTYNNLMMSGSGGATATADVTVNGILNLSSVNPSGTKGILDMGTFTLLMGPAATTSGPGDVTGIVRRTSLVANIPYSFGNRFTTVTFPNTGTLPTEWSFKIEIGTAPAWKTEAIKRTYDIVRTGGSGSFPTVKLHYLDSELNSNPEADLVFFGYAVSNSSVNEYGRVNADIYDNWVSLSGSIEFAPESFGERAWTLSERELPGFTWQGTVPGNETDWNDNMNWVGGSVPISTSDVIIPAGRTYYPTLPSSTAINSISIEDGAAVNGGPSASLTINGGNAAWYNRGTFNPETSTIIFTNAAATMSGETNFYNITINPGAGVTLTTDNIMRIAGSLVNSGSLDATVFPNTVEYNGDNQSVINPNGATTGYYHLRLSGSGTKTMPGTSLAIYGNFSMAGTASASAGASITVTGSFSLGSGTTFTAGSLAHSIGGNFEDNGATFTTAGSTFTFNGAAAQTIGGAASSMFYNLTLDNSNGLTLLQNESINGTLAFNNGKISLGAYDLQLGSSATITGSGSAKYVVTDGTGALRQNVPVSNTVTYPIGLTSAYLPITVQLTALSTADNIKARVANDLNTAYDANDVATGTPITNRVVLPVWFLKESVAGGTDATVTLQWNAANEGTNFHRDWCNVAHYTSGSWHYSTSSEASGPDPFTQSVSGIASFSPFGVFGQSLTCSFPGTTFLAGDALTVDYIATGGTWNSGNVFTAQLSDATGSFASPVTIGTLASTTSGSIAAIIPANTMGGTGYRIRVAGSDPDVDGSDNGSDLIINSSPTFTACPTGFSMDTEDGLCSVIVNYIATASGEPEPELSYTFSGATPGGGTGTGSGSEFNRGVTEVTITATNSFGIAVCEFTISVTDNEAPILSCPGDQEIMADCITGLYTVTGIGFDPIYSWDNCGTVTSLTNNFNNSGTLDGAVFPAGTTSVIWTALDDAVPPNETTCSFDVIVYLYSISGTLKYNNAAKTPMNNVELTISPAGANATSTTDGSGNYSFTGLCPGDYTIAVTNISKPVGYINSTDASMVNAWSANQVAIEHVKWMAGDVNLSYTAQSTDAKAIQNWFVHYGNPLYAFDRGEWAFYIAGEPVVSNSDPNRLDDAINVTVDGFETVNLYGQAVGDFNGSFVPGGLKAASETLSLVDGETQLADASSEVELSVRIMNSEILGAASLILNYPSELFEVTDISLKLENGNLDWFAKGGELRIGWNTADPLWLEAGSLWLSITGTTSSTFSPGDEIRFTLAADPLNELADGNNIIIPDAKLGINVLAFSTTGTPENVQGTMYNEKCKLSSRPNPFSGYSIVDFRLPMEGHVTLEITDILGRRVALLVDEYKAAGEYSLKLDATPLQPGVYMATLKLQTEDGDLVKTIKLIRKQ